MLLTNSLQHAPTGGRQLLCKLNHGALLDIYGERLVLIELPHSRLRGLKSLVSAFRGEIDGLNDVVIAAALKAIEERKIGKIFVDGSNLGGFVKIVKEKFPAVEVSTFFHNVESRFFLGLTKTGQDAASGGGTDRELFG